MKTWLVLDVHFMCHRAFHVNQDLSWKGKPSGVIFGFLKSIAFLKDEFQTDRIAFCFEHPLLHRRDVYHAYKQRRNSQVRTEPEIKALKGLMAQINALRTEYLPRIGFKNVFCAPGYESDDLMASIALHLPDDEEAILVTADQDLYQCLKPNVTIYSPQKRLILSEDWFTSKYGIRPKQWAVVKAIAGCASDEVEGIKGVGELTALKYVRDELPITTRAHLSIISRVGRAIVRRNKGLVQLPYEGCPICILTEDHVDREGWKEVCGKLGMRSIAQSPPVATRKRGGFHL